MMSWEGGCSRGMAGRYRELQESIGLDLGHQIRGRIEIERDDGPVPPVVCYPNRLNQVFMNLLVNACQAIAETGTISVRTDLTDAGLARSQSADTGGGMTPDVLERMFEPGFTTKGARVGMGLGLLMTRQIVEQHAGSISARSTPGEGTTFTIQLPLRLTAPTEAANP